METLSTVVAPTQPLDIYEQVFAEVVLGRPSANCKHLGICKIERIYTNDFYSTMLHGICKSASKIYALATLIKGRYFELAFQRAFMEPENEVHFKGGLFVMEEDYYLDNSFMSEPIHLKKGAYKVRVSDRLLTIRFDGF